jgi:ADP-ribose pyrophosphatase YjhB (NUDIX family)
VTSAQPRSGIRASVEAAELEAVQREEGDEEENDQANGLPAHASSCGFAREIRWTVPPVKTLLPLPARIAIQGRSMLWRRRLQPIAQPLFRLYARATRSMTLGVRGAVVNAAGEVLLVEHTYIDGWHLPGGGVELGETAVQAMGRELVEEAGVRLIAPPTLVAVHANVGRFRGDHVLLYRVDAWEACPATSRGEIHQTAWFSPAALPEGTTAATRRRVIEALGLEM